MKKILGVLGICILLVSPLSLAESGTANCNNIEHRNGTILDDPPEWANGKFNGTWGLSVLGLPAAELGWVEGYFFAAGIFGRFEGYFAEWKDEEPVSFIAGFILLFNMVGYVGSLQNPDNGTFFSGLGAPNENGEFYYRINLIIGPSWYMQGKWEEL